jgi:glycosyltransferase involved in cell wall biosynthesis
MKILFITLSRITSINQRGIYPDLIREFSKQGHKITIVSPFERRFNQPTQLIQQGNVSILKVKTLNIQKTNLVEKGVGTLLLELQYLNAFKKYYKSERFDLILYSTPPIAITAIIEYIKKRDNAKTYLLLKDIFPQNAVDLGMMSENGFIHRFFRKKEIKLYKLSDFIGCMSPANVNYLLKNNNFIAKSQVEVNPNSTEPMELEKLDLKQIQEIKLKYNIPLNKTVFVYGGNLGKPQGIDFLLKVLESQIKNDNIFFIIIGSGTELPKVKKWYHDHKQSNTLVMERLPKNEYDELVKICDIGLIFLDARFTIPNFPSRLLSYIEIGKPVLAATDENTDVGEIMEENGFGLWAKSGDLDKINHNIHVLSTNKQLISSMGEKGYNFFLNNFTSHHSYELISKRIKIN